MVIALDTSISETLRLEGYARDIVRLIQDMRKDADYGVSDRIELSIAGEGSAAILESFGDYITHETLSTLVPGMDSSDREKTESVDE
jgi:isoleucyl-tRNA synthetase